MLNFDHSLSIVKTTNGHVACCKQKPANQESAVLFILHCAVMTDFRVVSIELSDFNIRWQAKNNLENK